MIRIRHSSREVDVEGTAGDLRSFRSQVLELALHGQGQVTVAAETGFKPKPYDRVLSMAVLSVGPGPTMVEVTNDNRLLISASPDNLRRLASFIDVQPDADNGWHSHYEYFDGNPYIMRNAEPMIFSLRRLTTA